jgi:hypothetical protein
MPDKSNYVLETVESSADFLAERNVARLTELIASQSKPLDPDDLPDGLVFNSGF